VEETVEKIPDARDARVLGRVASLFVGEASATALGPEIKRLTIDRPAMAPTPLDSKEERP
jgi:hypothetical protein